MNRTFAIGDIHGCSKTFKTLLLEKIKVDHSDVINSSFAIEKSSEKVDNK